MLAELVLTLKLAHTEAIEVLLAKKAFFVKRVAGEPTEHEGPAQITWSKFDGAEKAWQVATQRAHFK